MKPSAVQTPTYHPCQCEYVKNDRKKETVSVPTKQHRSVLKRILHFLVLNVSAPPTRFLLCFEEIPECFFTATLCFKNANSKRDDRQRDLN